MRFDEIVRGLLPWCAGAAAIVALVWCAGRLLLRRVLPAKKLLAFAALCGYAFVVLGLTNFSRESGSAYMQVNLVPFSAWADGFGDGSLTAFQLIVFNVLMFVPLGVLLPLVTARMRGFGRVVFAAFLCSLFVETLQLRFATGIFELDDLLHNTMGAALGYALYALFSEKTALRKRRMARVATVLGLYIAIFSLMGAISARFEGDMLQQAHAQDIVIATPLGAVERSLRYGGTEEFARLSRGRD